MVFKPKNKIKVPEKSKEELDKVTIAELKKQIEEAQKEVDAMKEEEEVEEAVEEEVPEIEPKKVEEVKEVNEEQEQLKFTAEEVIASIEFNIARAGQLLQLLK